MDDRDSVVALPKAALVGAAAPLHAGGGSSTDETDAFPTSSPGPQALVTSAHLVIPTSGIASRAVPLLSEVPDHEDPA